MPGLDHLMNKQRRYLDRLIAWVLIAYAIGFLLGEFLRDEQYQGDKKKRANYSGLFILLRHKSTLSAVKQRRVKRLARMLFAEITHLPSPVPT